MRENEIAFLVTFSCLPPRDLAWRWAMLFVTCLELRHLLAQDIFWSKARCPLYEQNNVCYNNNTNHKKFQLSSPSTGSRRSTGAHFSSPCVRHKELLAKNGRKAKRRKAYRQARRWKRSRELSVFKWALWPEKSGQPAWGARDQSTVAYSFSPLGIHRIPSLCWFSGHLLVLSRAFLSKFVKLHIACNK